MRRLLNWSETQINSRHYRRWIYASAEHTSVAGECKQILTVPAEIPVDWAATGVDFLMFLKPSVPHDVRTMDRPALSVSWMCVLGAREEKCFCTAFGS